jgi:membrane protease YdiL (CAAX protease family)
MLRAAVAWVQREYRPCRAEFHRLRGIPHRPVPVVGAVGASVFVAVLGNAVVVAGRRWNDQSEWITLVGVPAIGLAGVAVLLRRGWCRRDLGFRWPAVDPPSRFAHAAVALAVAVATASGIIRKITGADLPAVEVVRLLVGTAFGEELVHRGVVLGVWANTTVRGRWVVVANMSTFALWHVAAATHRSGFRWWEVAGPGGLTLVLLWGRLRNRSIVAPVGFHAATNIAGFRPPT